ncbi:MAG: DUF6562 domain-containing protein [Bacteroidales bacterium]
MKNKYILLFLHTMCLLISCIVPSVDDEDSINVTYQVRIIAPDSLLSFPNQSLREVLKADENLMLWLTSELYELSGSKRNLLGRYDEEFDVYSQTLNSYTLKSNADYLLLYFLEFKRSHESFYDIDYLTNVKLRGQDNTIHIEPNKEVFVGKTELKGRSKDFCDTIILKSPFSFYLLQATDLITFIEKHRDLMLDSVDVNVKYLSYYPYEFDVQAMKPIKSDIGINYKQRIALINNQTGTLDLAYDFLFMGEERSLASIHITIRDPKTLKVFSRRSLQFDYMLGKRRVLQGNFLTGNQNGIVIDTAFYQDIIIEF